MAIREAGCSPRYGERWALKKCTSACKRSGSILKDNISNTRSIGGTRLHKGQTTGDFYEPLADHSVRIGLYND